MVQGPQPNGRAARIYKVSSNAVQIQSMAFAKRLTTSAAPNSVMSRAQRVRRAHTALLMSLR